MTENQTTGSKKRLLFLSLDGVVHKQPDGALPTSWDTGVLPILGIRFFLARPMRRIITLCEEYDVGLVLTSSWRLAGFSLAEFNQVFKGLVVGTTPDLSENNFHGPLREREIQAYLDGCDEGIRYAIVDSRQSGYSTTTPNLYITDAKELFSDELAVEIGQQLL